jgi:tetratricopeptide (TPR) repeat protein
MSAQQYIQRAILPLLVVLVWGAPTASRAASGLAQLQQLAHRWDDRGRADKAVEVWRKVLRLDADNLEALAAVGCWAAHRGQTARAQQLLDRLKSLAPKSVETRRLRRALAIGAQFDDLIDRARKHVRNGNLTKAVAAYKRAFGATPPQRFALEYYQTLGGTPGGWEPARAGLEQNARRKPASRAAQLAYAKHLTYRAKTRREGIEKIAELQSGSGSDADGTKAWRQALLWLDARPADSQLYAAYLAHTKSDAVIQSRLDRLTRASRSGSVKGSLQAGYRALERNDVEKAGRIFGDSRRTPEALVGLAMVAMKREDFELAQELLEQVKAKAPKRPELWERSLSSATFWATIKQAERATQAEDFEQAEQLLRGALDISPGEAHHARLALANLALRQQRYEQATALLQAVLHEKSDQPDALRALVAVYLQSGAYEKALETNRRLERSAPAKALPPEQIDAEVLRRRAARLQREGQPEQAMGLLLSAFELAPKSYWVIHDLASLQIELGELAQARKRIATLVELQPTVAAGRLLQARLEAEAKHYTEALEILKVLPASALDRKAQAMVEQVRMRAEVDRAVRFARKGSGVPQRRRLLRLEQQAGKDPALVGIVALGWAEIGDHQRATDLIYDALSQHSQPPAGLRLQLAAVLMKAERDAELLEVIHGLQADNELGTRERRDLQRMRIAHAVRRSDELGRAGEYQRALLQLEPLLQEQPEHRALLDALGRLFYQSGDYREAATTFRRVLQRHPRDLEAREGAILTAGALHHAREGERLTTEGLDLLPNSARMHLIAARYFTSTGDDARAMEALTRAQALAGAGDASTSARTYRARIDAGPVPSNGDTRSLIRFASHRYANRAEPISPAEGYALNEGIDAEIRRIRSRHNVRVPSQIEMRHRAGRRGLDRLSEMKIPLAVSIPLRYSGRIGVHVTPVLLSAGSVALGSPIGDFGVADATDEMRGSKQQDVGAALRVSYRYRDALEIDVGSTPLGFLEQNVVGGLSWRNQWGPVSLTLNGARRPVTDSVLSYAGTVDDSTQRSWGGVMRQGGRIDLGFDTDAGLFYLIGGGYFYNGSDVDTNASFLGSVGAEWEVHDWGGHTVVLGANVFAMGYQKNLSQFTLGHGGYFSPEVFARGSAPLRWRGDSGRLRWNLTLDPGISWFRSERAPLFPTDSVLQQARRTVAEEVEDPSLAFYPADSQLGFSFTGDGRIHYELTRLLDLGAFGAMRVAPEFREYIAGAFLRVNFRGRGRNQVRAEKKLQELRASAR